ncbi:MAG: AAA family ATPase, partial [Candidatus Promineifilaceae bacterium]
MKTLHLQFLGPPRIFLADTEVTFPTRKSLALLTYLVMERKQHSREHLGALFWPESDRARANLRNTLNYLRKSLTSDAYLEIDRHSLAFNETSPFLLDLDQINSHNADDPALLALIRGEFLAGFYLDDAPEFDHWLRQRRVFWQQRTDTLYDHISAEQSQQGLTEAAFETLTRWVVHNPVNEAAYRRLMRHYLLQDDRTAVLTTYEQCRVTLAAELGVSPSPETEALRHTASQWELTPPSRQDAASPPLLTTPFVGRTAEWQALIGEYHYAAKGATRLVTVVGEAGIGKTRLAAEFGRWARTEGADLLSGRGFEMGTHLPYQTIVEAVRPRLERENAPDDLLADVWLAELSRLLPELRDRYPDLPLPETDSEAESNRLFEALTRLVTALSEKSPQPLLIWLDDWQWADSASLAWLPYALRRWHEGAASILVLLTMRTGIVDLDTWLQGVERETKILSLHLLPLPEVETVQLVQALSVDERAVVGKQVFQATTGQPFHLVSLLQMWVEQKRMLPAGKGKWEFPELGEESAVLPEPVRQRIARRLQSLSPAAVALLTASAALGHQATFAALCHVS